MTQIKLSSVKSDLQNKSDSDNTLPKTISDIFLSEIVSESLINDEIEPKYINLVLSGGSIKGICHVGALQTLINEKLIVLKKIKAISCASAGALFGCLLVLGFTTEEAWDFLLHIDFNKLVKPDIVLFLHQCGVDTGKIIYDLMEQILAKKTGIENINFKQLYEITKIKFIIIGSCLTEKEEIHYNHIDTPDFQVSMAIRISIGMPGFFIPVEINGKKYIDGALLNNYPMDIFEDELDQTIGILICDRYDTNYQYPEEFFFAILNLFMHNCAKSIVKKYPKNTICIDKNLPETSIFNFEVNNELKHQLYQAGIASAEDFINRVIKARVKKGEF